MIIRLIALFFILMFVSTYANARGDAISRPTSGVHDFDFLFGQWQVHHRRLKERLRESHDWVEFDGTSHAQSMLGGQGNMDDNILNMPEMTYRAVTLRAFDEKTGNWSIWWLDGRTPTKMDPPVVGHFSQGVGTFYADDSFDGLRIRVRFIWSHINKQSCRWEQAFSKDGGKTWETNWIMEFQRRE